MLLNKKLFLVLIMLLLLLLPISYAQVCELGKVKDVLRKILYLYFTGEGDAALQTDEVKDLLVFYLTISSENITVDCSALGSRTNKPVFEFISLAESLPDKIPSCGDGTKYGHCSANKPGYCYAGSVYSKCDLCGCPVNSRCGKSGKCDALAQNITCFKDMDCGQNDFIGDYYCTGNYINRNYTNYTCQNPGTVNSRCVAATGSVFLTYCNPNYNQVCVAGKNTCQTSINDSAPTVSIVVNPTAVTQGQFFNVTVAGTDDVGLVAIWWWGVNTADAELNKAHWYSCNGAKFCTYSWLVSTNATGTLTLGANSRDTAYPVAGQPHQASEGAGIAYVTLSVTSVVSNATSIDTLTIKGRLIDYFTKQPIANAIVFTWDTQTTRHDVYTNINGEFSITADTALVTASTPKSFGISPACYDNMGFALFRNSDNSLYVNVQINSLVGPAKSFTVSGSEVNLGDIPMWPAVDIQINSDIAVKFNLEYNGLTGSGNSLYKTLHYLSYSFPLTVDTRTKLTDQANNIYYSPYLNVPLSNGCTPVNLNFFNKQFSWNSSITQANATNNCFVKIDGIVVKSVYATDRNDCYSKTSFGSENCKTYAPYFTDGVHFLEQYFGTNDRVNNEYCTCTNGVCVQDNQTLTSPTRVSADFSYSYDLSSSVARVAPMISFQYLSTDIIDKNIKYFRLYNKKPGESIFSKVAEFTSLPTTPGSATTTFGGWKLSFTFSPSSWLTFAVTSTGANDYQPASNYAVGAHSYYITAVDSSGRESNPSVISTINILSPITILNPTAAQSPVSSTPTFQWTLPTGWPSSPSPDYIIYVIDQASNKYQWQGYSKNSGLLYSGTTLDPAKKYSVMIEAEVPINEQVMYFTISNNLAQFWVSGNQTNATTCTDSDGGYNIYKAGLTDGRVNGIGQYFYDTCVQSNGGYCSDLICAAVAEGYCADGKVTNLLAQCPNGCQNGACINQTAKLCAETNKLVNFENPPHLSFHLTWNPDLGTQDSYNYNLDETARNWLRAQGIEITGTPNGIVWGTGISGPVGTTGVVIGDASPSFAENDQGISDNEILTVRFLNSSANSVTVTVTSTPSNVASINNIPATVIMDAYNSAGSLVTTASKTFTGVTNGVYTPTTMSISSTNFDIAKITLRTTQHPYGGVWLEDINFKICT